MPCCMLWQGRSESLDDLLLAAAVQAGTNASRLSVCTGPKDDAEESGWKMVSGDVFRPPPNATLLCVQVGSGVQIIASAFMTLFFAALGAPSCAVKTPGGLHCDQALFVHQLGYSGTAHVTLTMACRIPVTCQLLKSALSGMHKPQVQRL